MFFLPVEAVHEGIKHPCHICQKEFSRKTHVARHLRNAHPEAKKLPSNCLKSYNKEWNNEKRIKADKTEKTLPLHGYCRK